MTTQNLGHSIAALLRLRMGKTRPRILFGAMLFGAALWLVAAPQARAQATSPDPIVFTNADITPADRALHVSWTLGANVVGGSVATSGTFISWRTAETSSGAGDAGAWREDVIAPTTTGPYVITPLTNGVAYDVRLISEGHLGAADSTPTIATGTPAAPTAQANAPAAPTALVTSSISTTGLTISWTASATTGTNAATGYQVRWAVAGTGDWQDASGDDTDCTDGDDTNDEDCGVQVLNAAGQTLAITGLAVGTEYEVEVLAENADAESNWVGLAPLAKTISTAPDVPATAGAGVTAGKLSLVLTWVVPNNNGEPITQYRYRYDTDGVASTWENSGGATGTIIALADISPIPSQPARRMFTIRGLDSTVTYSSVQIAAENSVDVSAFGSLGSATSPDAGTVPDTLAAPTGEGVAGGITISWVAPADDGGSDITSYSYRWSDNDDDSDWENASGATGEVIPDSAAGEANAASYTITGLEVGTEYVVQVLATNATGPATWSPSSAAIRAASAAPAPTLATPIAARLALELTWTPPTDTGGAIITGYLYRWTTDGGINYGNASGAAGDAAGDATATTFTITGLTAAAHQVQIAVNTADGRGAWTPLSDAVTPTPAVPPPAPTGLTVTNRGDTTLTVGWTAPTDNGGQAITGYVYRWTTDGGTTYGNAGGVTGDSAGGADAVSFEITGLTNGTDYTIDIAADNGVTAPLNFSAPVTASPAAAAGAPTIDTATSTGGNARIVLAWTAPAEDGGEDITAYLVRWTAEVGGATEYFNANGEDGQSVGSVLTYTIQGLKNGTEYTLSVAARNAIGAGDFSTTHAITPMGEPYEPRSISLATSDGTITATWVAPAMTGGSAITGYFYRWSSDSNPETYQSANGNAGVAIAGSGATTTTATITTDIANGTTYAVQIAAANANGTGAWSQAATATPFGTPEAPAAPTATGITGGATISWVAPTETGGLPITGFAMRWVLTSDTSDYLNTGGADGFVIPNSAGLSEYTANYIDGGLAHQFSVAAINALGTGEFSPIVAVDTLATTVPSAPRGIMAVPGVESIGVSWNPPETDGGSAIDNYSIRWRFADDPADNPDTGAAGAWIPTEHGQAPASFSSHQITGLTADEAYEIEVVAQNDDRSDDSSADFANMLNSVSVVATATATPVATGAAGDLSLAMLTLTDSDGTETQFTNLSRTSHTATIANNLTSAAITATATDTTNTTVTIDPAVATDIAQGASETFTVTVAVTADTSITQDYIIVVTREAAAPALPTAPTNVLTTSLDTALEVSWTAPADSEDLIGYRVRYRDAAETAWMPNNNGKPVGPTTAYRIDGLTNGTAYDVQVAAQTAIGIGAFGSTDEATPAIVPDAPALAAPVASHQQLTLSWTAPAQTGGAPITGYKVRWAFGITPTTWINLNGAAGVDAASLTGHTLSGLLNLNVYFVQVAAVNAAGTGAWTSSRAGEPQASVPDAPTLAEPVPGATSLVVNWLAPANDGGSAISGYRVRWKLSSDTSYPAGNITPADDPATTDVNELITATTHTITPLTAGTAYDVQVAAVNATGASEWSNTQTATPGTPGAPSILSVAQDYMDNGANAFRVTIFPPAAVTSYGFQFKLASETTWTDSDPLSQGLSSANAWLATIGPLAAGATYNVRVNATNDNGTGPWSAIQTRATPATPPIAKPTAPVVAAETFFFEAGTETGATIATSRANANQRVTLQMKASTGGTFPGTHTGRIIDGAADDPDVTLSILSEDITGLTYRAYGDALTAGTAYDVRYRLNTAAGVVSPWSDNVSFTAPAAPPRAGRPQSVTPTPAAESLVVTWAAPNNAAEAFVSGYRIRWRTAATDAIAADANANPPVVAVPAYAVGEWSTPIDLTGAATLTYTITNLIIHPYNVQVRSLGASRNSQWGASATATPDPSVPGTPTLKEPVATAGGFALSWDRVRDTGGLLPDGSRLSLTGYNIEYRATEVATAGEDGILGNTDDGTAPGEWMQAVTTSSATFIHTLTGLTAGTSYDMRLNAENSADVSAWSPIVTGTAVSAAADATPDNVVIHGLEPVEGGEPTATDRTGPVFTKGETLLNGARIQREETQFTVTVTLQTGGQGGTQTATFTDENGAVPVSAVDGTTPITLTSDTASAPIAIAPGSFTEYTLTVTAIDGVTTQDYVFLISRQALRPPPPPNVTVEGGIDSLTVTWDAVPDEDLGGGIISGYRVRFRRSAIEAVDADTTVTPNIPAVEAEDAGNWTTPLQIFGEGNRSVTFRSSTAFQFQGQSYDVQVASMVVVVEDGAQVNGDFPVDENGVEVFVSATPTLSDAPDAVRNIRSMVANRAGITVGWDAPLETGGRDVTSYHVRWRVAAIAEVMADNTVTPAIVGVPAMDAGAWLNAGGEDANCVDGAAAPENCGVELTGDTLATTYTIALADNAVYEVDVRASHAGGRGAWASDGVAADGMPAPTSLTTAQRNADIPLAPRLTVSAERGIRADWTPPTDIGGSAITSYRLRWTTNADRTTYINTGGAAGIRVGDGTARTYTLAGLTDGTRYRVAVAAVNAAGTGEWSTSRVAIPSVKAYDTLVAHASLSAFGNAVVASTLDIFSNNTPATRLAHGSAANGGTGNGNGFLSLGGAELSAQKRAALASEGEIAPIGWDTAPALREVDWREFLGDTAFRIGLGHNEGGEGGATLGIWGRGDVRGYEGRGGTSDMKFEGLSYAGYLGADYSADNWTVGIAASFTFAQADYFDSLLDDGGTTETWLATGYPYARYSPHEKVDMWATLGFGYGIHSVTNPDGDKIEAPVFQQLYAAGVKIDVARISNFKVAAKTDFAISLLELMDSDGIDGSTPQQQRWRFALETDRQISLPGGHNLHPSGEIAVRVDTGDTDRGEGLELGAGLRFTSAAARVSVEARGRGLVAHTVGDTREWGASLSARVSPGASGGGLSLSFTPGWGQTQSRADAMWANDRTVSDIAVSGGTYGWVPNSLRTEMGYGVKQGLALITPVAQYSLSGEQQTVGLGTRLALGNALNMELLGERVGDLQSFNADQAYRVSLTSRLRF